MAGETSRDVSTTDSANTALRLELGIDECIEIYKTLARRVFVKQVGRLQSITRALRKKTWFNSKSLEDVCKLVISQACGDENEPLLGNGRCKMLVTPYV